MCIVLKGLVKQNVFKGIIKECQWQLDLSEGRCAFEIKI